MNKLSNGSHTVQYIPQVAGKRNIVSRENLSLGFPTMSDTNWAVQPERILYNLCSKIKGTDQLCSYSAADLASSTFVFAYAKSGFLMTWLKQRWIFCDNLNPCHTRAAFLWRSQGVHEKCSVEVRAVLSQASQQQCSGIASRCCGIA